MKISADFTIMERDRGNLHANPRKMNAAQRLMDL